MELHVQPVMVDAHQREHRGVQVVDIDDVLDGVVAKFVGGAVGRAGLDAAAGEEDRVTGDVVVAAGALAHRGTAEFAAPEDERVVEHAALLEVADEGAGRLVDVFRAHLHAVIQAAVKVPGAVVELDHAYAAFGEAAGHEAVGGEGAVADFLDAVGFDGLRGLALEVEQLGDARLHLEGHLVLGHAGRDLRVDGLLGQLPVEAADLVDDLALGALAHAFGVADVVDGLALGLELDALVFAGQDAAGPLTRGDRLQAGTTGGGQYDVARQVLRFRAQAVEQPGAHARASFDDGTRVEEGMGRVVVDLLGLHRADDAEVVGDRTDVREDVGELHARLAPLLEFERTAAGLEHGALELGDLLALGERFREGLSVEFLQDRLIVEELEVGRAARHAEEDDALGLHREVRGFERPLGELSGVQVGETGLRGEHGEGRAAEAVGALREEAPSVDRQGVGDGVVRAHGLSSG